MFKRNKQSCFFQFRSEQIELLRIRMILHVNCSSSICSEGNQMKQLYLFLFKQVLHLYLFRSTFNVAPLSVPKHLKCCTSICSEAPLALHLYLFRSTLIVAPLFVPLHLSCCISICSEVPQMLQLYQFRSKQKETALFVPPL